MSEPGVIPLSITNEKMNPNNSSNQLPHDYLSDACISFVKVLDGFEGKCEASVFVLYLHG